jgi:hypothetical protein
MAVIYTVEQLADAYQQTQSETDQEKRKQMLNFILTASYNTANAYVVQMERLAQYYGIVLKKEQVTNAIVSVSQTIGIASSNVYGYAAAGLALLYDSLTKKKRTREVQEAIYRIEEVKAKVVAASKVYDSANNDLKIISIKEFTTNPIVWIILILVIIILSSI